MSREQTGEIEPNICAFIGVGSIVWSLIEMIIVHARLHCEIEQDSGPTWYWGVILFWLMLGVTCLIPLSWWY